MQIDRLFQIVFILMDKKKVTAKYLADRFEVSTRTIYRDVDTLSLCGIPVVAAKGKGGGISIMEHFVIDKSLFSEEEKSNLLMGLETLQLTNLDEVDMALGKLKTIFHQDSANWVKVDFSHWGNDPKVREKFENIKAAIMNQQKIEYDYYGSEGKMSRRVVWPHQLLFKDRAWYLIGYCEKREDFRTFKIVRINDLRVLEVKFIPKELPAYERSVGGGSHKPVILYKLFISKEMAYRVFEEMGGEIREEIDQGYYIDYPMEEDESVYDYFLSFGEFLEVLEPEEARKKMAHKIKLLANKYSC